ncbi:hypothetical protein [uncultured Faecalibaculum sp.]|uniref:hypothetical protein n=1 Tax=uncultured Faecalibaculum sp. TaxID=1729681 RepID=UPI00272E0F27|nr:hypothetical protein [uncultured Faecalibaculum sp.]
MKDSGNTNRPETVRTNARQVAATDRPASDSGAKAMLHDKQIISLVLKRTCNEYAGFSVRQISSRIQEMFRISLNVENDLEALNEKVETMDPSVTAAGEGTTINDQAYLIQDMESEQLYVVVMEVNNGLGSADVMGNRDLYYVSRTICSQRNRINGMNTAYEGLKPVKVVWIYPSAGFSDVVRCRLQAEAEIGQYPKVKQLCDHLGFMVDNTLVFIGPEWDNADNETINGLGHIFRNKDRQMALACMEKEGVVMSAEVVNATNEYCNDFQMLIPPSVMERAMDDLNRRHQAELALKDEQHHVELALKDEQHQAELALKNEQHQAELILKDERIDQVASERNAALKRIQELESQLAAKS